MESTAIEQLTADCLNAVSMHLQELKLINENVCSWTIAAFFKSKLTIIIL